MTTSHNKKRLRHPDGGHLSAVDEGYVTDLKEIREKRNERDWATPEEKIRCTKLYGVLASLMKGRAPQLIKTVGGSNGFGAWRSLSEASEARGLALLGAATARPAFSRYSALHYNLNS